MDSDLIMKEISNFGNNSHHPLTSSSNLAYGKFYFYLSLESHLLVSAQVLFQTHFVIFVSSLYFGYQSTLCRILVMSWSQVLVRSIYVSDCPLEILLKYRNIICVVYVILGVWNLRQKIINVVELKIQVNYNSYLFVDDSW